MKTGIPSQQQRTAARRTFEIQLKLWEKIWILCACSLVGLFLLLLIVKTSLGVPVASLPSVYEVGKGVSIFDGHNQHVCTVYADKDRKPVLLRHISPYIQNAVIAIEDHNFMKHHGIDPVGIARALVLNAKEGRIVQGASTITQQLVRNLYLDMEDRSLKRKLLEAVLAWDVENKYKKPKILETYLNEVYFGNGVYGVERAAEAYFNTSAERLSLAEAAFLAGLIKAPSDLGARVNRNAALARQQKVLDKVAEYGLASITAVANAKKEVLHFQSGAPTRLAYPYYVNYVLTLLKSQYHMSDEQLWGRGLRVYTYLDPSAQKAARYWLNKGISRAPRGINQGALVTQRVSDGAVLAMVGGVGDFRNHQWNRAIYPHTAGSAFKPFVYLAGLIHGVLQPSSRIDDTPVAFNMGWGQTYSPKDFDGRFLGSITVRDALALSRNVCSVRVADSVGINRVIETARAAGIRSPLTNNLAIALGSCAVSPLELSTAYATLARYGAYRQEQVIRLVLGADGKPIGSSISRPIQTLPQDNVVQIVDVLQDVVQRGTGTQAKLAGIPVAGKTGTADKARDIWFIGFTPDTVTAVWGGNDKYLPVRGNVTGGMVMAAIWHDYMLDFYRSHQKPENAFAVPKVALAKGEEPQFNPTVIKEIDQFEQGTAPDQLQQTEQAPEPGQAGQGAQEGQPSMGGTPAFDPHSMPGAQTGAPATQPSGPPASQSEGAPPPQNDSPPPPEATVAPPTEPTETAPPAQSGKAPGTEQSTSFEHQRVEHLPQRVDPPSEQDHRQPAVPEPAPAFSPGEQSEPPPQ